MADIERDARIFERDKYTCMYCGWKGDTFEKWRYLIVDHFKPKRCFRSNRTFDFESYSSDTNLVTACLVCNLTKADREFPTLEDARENFQKWLDRERRDYDQFFVC